MDYQIDGEIYSEEELISSLRSQASGIPEYSRFADAVIELCYENKVGELFFYISRDDGDDMMVKIDRCGNIYWDWIGQVMDD